MLAQHKQRLTTLTEILCDGLDRNAANFTPYLQCNNVLMDHDVTHVRFLILILTKPIFSLTLSF
jgi:hypothetical protein